LVDRGGVEPDAHFVLGAVLAHGDNGVLRHVAIEHDEFDVATAQLETRQHERWRERIEHGHVRYADAELARRVQHAVVDRSTLASGCGQHRDARDVDARRARARQHKVAQRIGRHHRDEAHAGGAELRNCLRNIATDASGSELHGAAILVARVGRRAQRSRNDVAHRAADNGDAQRQLRHSARGGASGGGARGWPVKHAIELDGDARTDARIVEHELDVGLKRGAASELGDTLEHVRSDIATSNALIGGLLERLERGRLDRLRVGLVGGRHRNAEHNATIQRQAMIGSDQESNIALGIEAERGGHARVARIKRRNLVRLKSDQRNTVSFQPLNSARNVENAFHAGTNHRHGRARQLGQVGADVHGGLGAAMNTTNTTRDKDVNAGTMRNQHRAGDRCRTVRGRRDHVRDVATGHFSTRRAQRRHTLKCLSFQSNVHNSVQYRNGRGRRALRSHRGFDGERCF
jgi:hypothetical protein